MAGARCDNILKIKPPLVFSRSDADRLVEELHLVLQHFEALPRSEQLALLEPWVMPAGKRRECAPPAPSEAAVHPSAQKKRKL